MKIVAFYNSEKTNTSLSTLTCGGSVVDLEDEIDEIGTEISILPKLRALYEMRKIYRFPMDCVPKSNGIYRVKFGDVLGNEWYLELKGE